METRQRCYEGVLVVHPDTSLEDQKALFKQNKKVIEEHKGKLHHCDTWGKRPIANPIKNISMAIFFHYSFYASGNVIVELERLLRINSSVLKFLHSRLEDKVPLEKHLERYRLQLEATALKERERERKRLDRKKERETQQKLSHSHNKED